MLRWLTNWYIDRLVTKERADLPVVSVQLLLDEIAKEIRDGALLFLETRDQQFVPLNHEKVSKQDLEFVSLIVTWSSEATPAWKTEEAAKALAERLASHGNIDAVVLLSRSLDSFVGYYVRVRPKLP